MAVCPLNFCAWNYQHEQRETCHASFDAHWIDYHTWSDEGVS